MLDGWAVLFCPAQHDLAFCSLRTLHMNLSIRDRQRSVLRGICSQLVDGYRDSLSSGRVKQQGESLDCRTRFSVIHVGGELVLNQIVEVRAFSACRDE